MGRIIAGSAKGAKLATPAHANTRPTTDRVREAVFSSLVTWAGSIDAPPAQQLAGIAFLDLFAGSGAVGLEAASRGAGPVVLVEKDASTAALISGNVKTTRLNAQVVTSSAASFLARPPLQCFDVVFLDPPYDYATIDVEALLDQLIAGEWLADDPLVIIERSKRETAPTLPDALSDHWSKTYGETIVFYLRTPEREVPHD